MRSFLIPSLFIGIMVLAAILLLSRSINQDVTMVDTDNGQPITFPTGTGPLEIPDTNQRTFKLYTKDGTLTVHNFLRDENVFPDEVNEGYYQLGYYIDPASPNGPQVPYSIEYIASTHYFGIALYQEPFEEARNAAEQFLLQHLDVSENELCGIKYMVSVPNYINSEAAGVDYRFSFCPDSIDIP